MSVTATLAASPVQDAAFDLLNVTAFATDLLGGRFYTDVPQGTAFPQAWLTFGDPMEEPLDTFGRAGAIVHLELHAFSTYAGDDECLDILSKAIELLHQSSLSVSGWSIPFVSRQAGHIGIEDYNGRVLRHGIVRVDVHARRDS